MQEGCKAVISLVVFSWDTLYNQTNFHCTQHHACLWWETEDVSDLFGQVVSEQLKEAEVRPIIMKPTLAKDILKHYTPVNNITHLSNVIEKVVSETY